MHLLRTFSRADGEPYPAHTAILDDQVGGPSLEDGFDACTQECGEQRPDERCTTAAKIVLFAMGERLVIEKPGAASQCGVGDAQADAGRPPGCSG